MQRPGIAQLSQGYAAEIPWLTARLARRLRTVLMKSLFENHELILAEAAIVEPLRRSANIELHPTLVNAALIYDETGREAMRRLYQAYIDIAQNVNLPFLMCTPTWRANQARVGEAKISTSINIDAAIFMQELRAAQKTGSERIKIGGMIGCKNDCYKPEEGLSVKQAEEFHSWQIDQLVQGGVDFLIAETLPGVEEAIGIARAMERSGLEYIISFVISRDGRVLDGTDLPTAIGLVDGNTGKKALGFMVNCAYPLFLCADTQPQALFRRLTGYLSNASALDQCDLDGADEVFMESVSDWGGAMLNLNRQYGVKVLGGCCGTDQRHLRYIAEKAGVV